MTQNGIQMYVSLRIAKGHCFLLALRIKRHKEVFGTGLFLGSLLYFVKVEGSENHAMQYLHKMAD